jgi:hypothetical protein
MEQHLIVEASYATKYLPPHYRGNPLIEALPQILSPKEAEDLLLNRPVANLTEIRDLPAHIRLHAMTELDALYVPRPDLAEMESDIGLLMRSGYLRRNPTLAATIKDIDTTRERMKIQGGRFSSLPDCLLVTALSGTGKTRAIRSILSLTPQVIHHKKYNGNRFAQKQIAWLSLDAPISGSPRGLMLRFFASVDRALELTGPMSYANQYGRVRMPIDKQIEEFAQVAATYHIGLIHIDDLQRLWDGGKAQGRQVVDMLIQLTNVVKVPLVFSGTHQLVRVLAGSLEVARRCSSGGHIDFPLPTSAKDPHFRLLVMALSAHQYLDEVVEFDTAWAEKLFELTLGLPAVMICVFTQAQKMALRANARKLKLEHLDAAFERHCSLLKPALQVLRSNDPLRFQAYEDLLPAKAQLDLENARLYKASRAAEMVKR